MRNPFIALLLAALFVCACGAPAGQTPPTDRKNAAVEAGVQYYEQFLLDAAEVPVAFVYDGKPYQGLGALEPVSTATEDTPDYRRTVRTFRLDENLLVRLEAALCREYGQGEYTVWFENTGQEPSRELSRIRSAVLDFDGADPVLRGCLGDHVNNYADYVTPMAADTTVSFVSEGGRATHIVFPYFDIVHGDGGTLLALGWAGTWNATFHRNGDSVHLEAGNCNGFDAVLLPGEKVRTALVVTLPYKGRDRDDASNLWREWFLKYNLPKADGKGNDIQPFSTTCFAGDTGLPNSDGSISERFYTWKRTLERLIYEDVVPDFRWFDAGWYLDPRGNTVPVEWGWTVGTWQLDTVKWPGKTFLASNEACHKAGMKVLMWFEPETVCDVEDLARNYGYNPEWAAWFYHNRYTNNLGNPDALEWTLSRILKTMGENGVDLFREDNNSDPGGAWKIFDAKEREKTGLPRTGITENKGIQGHYEMWDRIIAFCAENGKCTFIDNCASGGGRNDIESLRRSLPFMRSDADRTTTALRLSMTGTFCRWVPFHGANTKESVNQLESGRAGGSTKYITRASWLPVYNISERYTHDVILDYDNLRATFGEWKRYRHLLTKDMHYLTPWHKPDDTSSWTVYAYHDRHTDEGVLEAFRQETCPDPAFTARLSFLQPDRTYTLENEDTGEMLTRTGAALAAEGITIALDEPKSSAVWHILPKD